MQIALMLIFLGVWLLILWLGSIALEATGMKREKARFQTLSALTGTGFTTREAESIVNHPKRRRIASWLIFIGNAGIIAFIILLIIYLRAGLTAPSLFHIGMILIAIFVISLLIKLGVIDKLTSGIISLVHKGRPAPYLLTEEILYQVGHYGIVRVVVSAKARVAGLTIKDIALRERGITILAIERGDTALSLPKAEEIVLAGDYLLCYGEVAEMLSITP